MLTCSLKSKRIRYLFSFIAVVISALLQAYVIQVFITPSNLSSSGLTGVAILVDKIAALYGYHISTSVVILMLSTPMALICSRNISKEFTILSTIQFVLASVFLSFRRLQSLFHDLMLNVIFGGFLYGLCAIIALKGSTLTGGTDFTVLYVSNEVGGSTWEQVFIFNALILYISGLMFGWPYIGYSVVSQFIITKTISTSHYRYERITIRITTTMSELVIDIYVDHYRHGTSCVQGYNGFSKKGMYPLYIAVSSYKVADTANLLREADPRITIGVLNTEEFYGSLYVTPMGQKWSDISNDQEKVNSMKNE